MRSKPVGNPSVFPGDRVPNQGVTVGIISNRVGDGVEVNGTVVSVGGLVGADVGVLVGICVLVGMAAMVAATIVAESACIVSGKSGVAVGAGAGLHAESKSTKIRRKPDIFI